MEANRLIGHKVGRGRPGAGAGLRMNEEPSWGYQGLGKDNLYIAK